ncbi:bifunctional ligase/repressor BirA [Anaerocolumna cellulosilytica]|uniref:Bifunctional ligase/repressor BirA n=1 Tax=Anaerocolumna cellulosilytica TaxID=433286 RepID=A0A6S6QUF7_9FIRM|nr:biotin--[acetyl-CoA-carboxylase] ligase [Anaerocolumna cellulosilytica]MBB5194773.1 BirA family biotin operon repressor/biotin-[acetyl-CoA-carboxylase] ligase [Anaerocolumna cellulosilytica]BCJ94264.1 bifunctional ligase/repressor BirA [Anaerocolumna cellulosilytica]
MSAKQYILSILEENKGKSVSGAKLAKELSVSRNAIWKAVKNLQADGYAIEAVPNKGYCLSENNDILSGESIMPYLTVDSNALSITVQNLVTSTNTVLKEWAVHGAPEGTILIAEEQTQGRGRMGRPFYSPAKTGIYMSILLRPALGLDDSVLLTTSAAVAVSNAIEEVTGCQTKIKWVNDIYIKDKKVCGILTEGSVCLEGGGLEYCIVGIGINVSRPEGDFPGKLRHTADGIFSNSKDSIGLRSRLAATIINNFWAYYKNPFHDNILTEYRNRSFIIGKEIEILSGDTLQQATAVDIDTRARLVVRYQDGTQKILTSGDVSIKYTP